MPVPGYETFMLPARRAMEDGEEHRARDLRERVAYPLTAPISVAKRDAVQSGARPR